MDTIRLGGARYLWCRADIRACRYVREDVYNVRQEQCTQHLLAEIQPLESTTFVCCQYAKRQEGTPRGPVTFWFQRNFAVPLDPCIAFSVPYSFRVFNFLYINLT